ncbi:hypothetical protein GGX14DRAFT_553370 [Mycena pura]|uniref:Ubiquitin-like protease family profile domain-containing protein n=1 Tax=Mycena pura TaxID=153505 RepID=A0AAD7E5Z3_9AGAR|nr:hypothetical protein GGX14DRAFT_553370 [Mycena pura]
MGDLVFNDDELQRNNPLWNPDEWIGCNQIYHDIPEYVSREATRARSIPEEVLSTLPSESLSPAGFFSSATLPVWDTVYDACDLPEADVDFDATQPSFLPEKSTDWPLLPSKTIQRLDAKFGQAWLDGMKSIRDARDPESVRYLPVWAISYAASLRQMSRCWDRWRAAIFWSSEERDDEEPDESMWRTRTLDLLSSIVGWMGRVGCGLQDLAYENLAQVLGENMLQDSVVDALVQDINKRLGARDGATNNYVLADTFFATCMSEGAATASGHAGHQLIAKYKRLLTSPSRPRYLGFPLHSPPLHWATCQIDLVEAHVRFADSLRRRRPKDLFDELQDWLTRDIGIQNVKITDDLPCGRQRDSVNCGIISANTLAHAVLGDALWDPREARTYRFKAFCTIATMILHSQEREISDQPLIEFAADSQKHLAVAPATDADVEMLANPSSPPAGVTEEQIAVLIDTINNSTETVTRKRSRKGDPSDSDDDDKPAKKRTKTVKAATASRMPVPTKKVKAPLEQSSKSERKPTIPEYVQLEILDSMRTGGQGHSSKHDRLVGILVKHGLFRGNEVKMETLRKECQRDGGDQNPGLDINNPKQVICSRCLKAVQLKAVYEAGRFREHWAKGCKKAPTQNKSITGFFASKSFKAVDIPPKPPKPTQFEKHCPGLTGAMHPRIEYYIDNCPATGAGAREINVYVQQLFESRGIESIRDPKLTKEERVLAYHYQALDRDWRIETSPHRSSVVAVRCCIIFTVYREADLVDDTIVCPACWAVYLRKEFRTAINRKRGKTHMQLKCTPKIYSNPIQSRLMAQYQGLEELLADRSPSGVFLRFARGVALGHYKDFKVFLGLVETMVMATERRIRGVGMQNFKYPTEFREFGALIRLMSPRTYRTMERSIQQKKTQRPRFPLGITAQSFEALARYCQDYGYPSEYPLCFSVDDTKLFPAMQPLYDGSQKAWYLVGLPGEQQLKVTSADELEKLMDIKHTPAPKLRLWVVQIPYPGVPPLAFAVLPIASQIKGPELAKHQLRAMDGLVEHKFRFISNVADGAAVERDCQARVAAASKTTIFQIAPPSHINPPLITVPLYNYKGNIFINTQDAPHARKTGRNNFFSGARGLVLGDFVAHYKQLYNMAKNVPDPTLYDRDVIHADKQDDNAAHRVFSAATLKGLADDVGENMGLIVLAFVIGDLVDAYESRTMAHVERAKVVIRARLFFDTWKLFLRKMGYSLSRYYVSHAADKIFDLLIDGLLGLIVIHRDHLVKADIPLLPWKHESMGNERVFAALRDIFPEMSLFQTIVALPHLRATMAAARQAAFSQSGFKKVANGYSLFDVSDDKSINFASLATFPTDADLTLAYGEAYEENDMLWSLLNVNIRCLVDAPTVASIAAPVSDAESPEHVGEDDEMNDTELPEVNATGPTAEVAAVAQATVVDLGIGDELDRALHAVQDVCGLRKSEEGEVDAVAYAAASLVVDNLAKIDDLPELEDPAQLEQCRKDIAKLIKMTPESVTSLLKDLKASFGPSSGPPTIVGTGSTSSLLDVTASDLLPLVAIRERHQTEHARKGVRNYQPPHWHAQTQLASDSAALAPATDDIQKKDKSKSEPTERRLLAQRLQAVMRSADARKATTGLNRKAITERPEGAPQEDAKSTGNAANAALAAKDRADDTKVAEADITHLTPLEAGNFVFIIEKTEILLANVLSIYSKGGGKAGRHDWVPQVPGIGKISYILAQTFEHSGGRSFRRIHRASSMLGVSRFAHLPSGSILVRIPDLVKLTPVMAEVSRTTAVLFKNLQDERSGLVQMVTTLNTVQKKGKGNINIMDVEEEGGVED